jgi:hypothetical protein
MSMALIPVKAPNGIGCLNSPAGTRYAEMVDGRLVIKMGWAEFRDLITSPNNGHLWQDLNPDLVRQLSDFRL